MTAPNNKSKQLLGGSEDLRISDDFGSIQLFISFKNLAFECSSSFEKTVLALYPLGSTFSLGY